MNVDSDSPRSKIIAVRFFTYGVMTISTILISAVSLLFALGYRFDNESLTVEQGGLLQFVSAPADAQVILDGKRQNFRTPGKATVMAGEHEVTMRLDGYREWSKTVNVEAGQILWLNYTRFIPESLTTTTVREFDALHASLVSPNKRYVVLQPTAQEPRLIIANIRDEDKVAFVETTLPAASYTQDENEPHTFELVEWNLDGRFLLIRHMVGATEEFIRFDRENPTEAINLTTLYGPITKAQFAGNNGSVLYALVNGNLQKITLASRESQLLSAGVTFFVVYRGDTVGFIADRNGQREVGIIKDERETLVSEYPLNTPLTIAVSHYFNRDYMAIATENRVDIIREPADARTAVAKALVSFSIDQPQVQWLYFSNNGRFLVAQHQGSFTTYDLELSETYEREFNTTSEVTRPFRWLDDYYLWVDLDGNLRIVEFDGANERVITSVERGYSVTLSDNADVLFSIGRNSATNKLLLQRSQLVIKQ